jgi:exodeoxyribonuclease X
MRLRVKTRRHDFAASGPYPGLMNSLGPAHCVRATDQPSRFVRVIDLETTGNGFADGGVVEVGWQDVACDAAGRWALQGPPGAMLINPQKAISPATSAIHHIIDADVADAPLWQHAAPGVLQPGDQRVALAAHRANFEQRWCVPALSGPARWICTYKCALRLFPDAPTHSNQGLRYWRMPEGLDRDVSLPAHRAGPDAYVTAHHLRDMLELVGLEQLLVWSEEPALLVRVPFGAYRGRAWRDLDDAALDRLLAGEAGRNQDVMFTAQMERQRRGGLELAGMPSQDLLL